MKKILLTISTIVAIMVLFVFGHDLYKDWSFKKEIDNYPKYYRELANDCKLKGSQSCCIASVQNMESGKYKLSPDSGCPKGYQGNTLKCIDSYKWCEPIK